jgi:cation:H+ antiporter
MMPIILGVSGILVSLILLYFGAKNTLRAAVWASSSLGVSKVVAGCVIVAFITAMPELFSSLFAAVFKSSNMAFGNILGSNIYNVPLIIGLCGLVGEFTLQDSIVEYECWFMIGLGLLMGLTLMVTGRVMWWMGLLFLVTYPVFVYFSVRSGKMNNHCTNNVNNGGNMKASVEKPFVYLVLGGITLLAGTFILVRSALYIVEFFGIKEFYVGLTIMALGSILPETAVSIVAAMGKEHEISVGNVIGDNIVTMTLVFGLVSFIRPFDVTPYELLGTVPFMVLVTAMLLLIAKTHSKVTRPLSLLMLVVAALTFIIQTMFFL